MPKISPRLLAKNIKPDGPIEIMLAIAHNGSTRYLKSGIKVDSPDQFTSGIIVKRNDAALLNLKLQKKVNELSNRLNEIPYIDGLSCQEISDILKGKDIRTNPTISAVFEEYIEVSPMKPASKELSLNLIKSIYSYLGKDLNLQNLSLKNIMAFDAYLRSLGNKPATIVSKISLISKLYTYCKRMGYVTSLLSPFSGYRPPEIFVRESWLTRDEIITLRDASISNKMAATLRDYIMLSYYLGGINIIDLLKIDFHRCSKNNILRYTRTKTELQRKVNKYVEFEIPSEAWTIIDKYIQPDGHLGTQYQRKTNMHDYFAQGVKSLRTSTGLPQVVYYSARKSFSQHAFQLGINTGVIDYILGHKLNRGGNTLYNYIHVTPQMATDAIRKVLDNLK